MMVNEFWFLVVEVATYLCQDNREIVHVVILTHLTLIIYHKDSYKDSRMVQWLGFELCNRKVVGSNPNHFTCCWWR